MTATTKHGWQLSGTSSDAYEEFLVPAIFDRWATSLVERANPQPGEKVLDVACGTGVVARTAAARVGPRGTVTGVDVNPSMLATARRAAPPGTALDWRAADAVDLPFPDAAFDVAFCQQGLQFVADRAAAVREIRRTLAASGRLAVSVWRSIRHNPGFALLADVLERHAGAAGPMMRAPFAYGDQDTLRGLFVEAGFGHVHIAIEAKVCRYPSPAELVRQQALASPIGEPLGQLHERERTALVADLDNVLTPYRDDDGLAMPMESHVVLAQ
jgi:ubiquinone/menaquinone biosynthesis C-methylase UbiE